MLAEKLDLVNTELLRKRNEILQDPTKFDLSQICPEGKLVKTSPNILEDVKTLSRMYSIFVGDQFRIMDVDKNGNAYYLNPNGVEKKYKNCFVEFEYYKKIRRFEIFKYLYENKIIFPVDRVLCVPSREYGVIRHEDKVVFNNWKGFIDISKDIQELKEEELSLKMSPALEFGSMLLNGIDGIEKITEEQEKIISYLFTVMAWKVQNPDKPAKIVIVFKGGQGVGKSTVFNIFKSLLKDKEACITTNDIDDIAGFNSSFERAFCVSFEEALERGKDTARIIKDFVTNDVLSIERKGIEKYQVKNISLILATTNEENPFTIDVDDRRMCIIDCHKISNDEERKRSANWFTAFYDWLEKDRGNEYLLEYLKRCNVQDFSPQRDIPQTQAKRKLIKNSLSMFDSFLITEFSAGLQDISNIERTEFYERFRSSANTKNIMKFQSFVDKINDIFKFDEKKKDWRKNMRKKVGMDTKLSFMFRLYTEKEIWQKLENYLKMDLKEYYQVEEEIPF